MKTHGHQQVFSSAAARLCTSLLLLLSLVACAEQDPYRRLEPGLATNLSTAQLVDAFNARWPQQFKCVQTVTLDFGPVTRTFNALLIVQRPGKFRLQGMAEQGLKLFELAHDEAGDHVIFKGDDISTKVIEGISRDIRRVFLDPFARVEGSTEGDQYYYLEGNTSRLTMRAAMVGEILGPRDITTRAMLARDAHASWPDCAEALDSEGVKYRFRQYNWVTTEASGADLAFYPSVIVLRDSGRESGGPPYKLTIKINELTLRGSPWPEKTFKP